MKKKFGFLSLIMLITLVACSNNNDAELVSENVVERKASEDAEETDKEEFKDNEEAEEKKAREKEIERDNAKENDETKERQQKEENKKEQNNKEKESPIDVKQYTDEGQPTDQIKNELVQFEVSGDTAAQEEWQRILSLYK